ncbi:hypothetical protein PSTT_13519 [Puccinia striiformis]|uniref:Protein kinase domain-containing protein n=1 Tax=Puccinia striiformis TaxID=27350 RepID=A0A2S4URF2_9BASI|nr:hypothetical protein PSTT_13519 [Puccinia striiformis]
MTPLFDGQQDLGSGGLKALVNSTTNIQSNGSIFVCDALNTNQLSSNSFKITTRICENSLTKLRSLRHPDILKFIDGGETNSAVYIITGQISSLSVKLDRLKMTKQTEVEWKIWGLSRISALKFLNSPGTSTHGNLRLTPIFITQSGEWKLSGLKALGGLFPEAARYTSPELMKTGYKVLKDIPLALSSAACRLALANPKSRLKAKTFGEVGLGNGAGGGGVAESLVKIFASPDRAIRLSLLELLPQYVDHLDRLVVVEKIWPNVLTGFTDTVPIIREAKVKSALLLAPKVT